MPFPTGVVSGPLMAMRWSDGDAVVGNGLEGFVGEPDAFAVDFAGFLAGEDLHPGDLALAAVGFRDGGVPDVHGGRRDVGADAVAFDVRDDRLVGDDEAAVGIRCDAVAVDRTDFLIAHEWSFMRLRNETVSETVMGSSPTA